MRASRTAVTSIAIAALASAAITFFVIANWQWYGSPAQIEAHLLERTPLGSSEAEVIGDLRKNAARFGEPWRGRIEPNTSYPPNTVAGSSFISAVVAEYTIVFSASVEAFYIFDGNRQLVEIAVRKSTDAL